MTIVPSAPTVNSLTISPERASATLISRLNPPERNSRRSWRSIFRPMTERPAPSPSTTTRPRPVARLAR
ncbi:hypothetical protein ACWGI0_23905 [Streptomyces sp. NPDC054802]